MQTWPYRQWWLHALFAVFAFCVGLSKMRPDGLGDGLAGLLFGVGRSTVTAPWLALRADNLLARQGGDKFLLLLADLPAPPAARIAEHVAEEPRRAGSRSPVRVALPDKSPQKHLPGDFAVLPGAAGQASGDRTVAQVRLV